MLYFKNGDLANTYHVSLRTVLNWIEATKKGKLDLVLHQQGPRAYIANTSRNVARIEQLVEEGRKYRNTRGLKTVTPRPEFYELYTQEQIYDIVRNLEISHEIPRQYNYFDGGADHWDEYATRLSQEEGANSLTSTQRLLEKNQSYIGSLLAHYKRVNIIDIGVGNCLPVKEFLGDFLEKGVLGRYIGVDISDKMLKIAQRNIKKWFGEKIKFESHKLDINHDRFATLLSEEYIKDDSESTANLILVFGGTLGNLRSPNDAFRAIHESMGISDYLFYAKKLDSKTTRRYFDFNIDPSKPTIAPVHKLALDFLNIDKSLYDVEMGFDKDNQQRYVRIRLKLALSIEFLFQKGKRIVRFNKGDTILLWRSWHQSALDVVNQLDQNDFYTLHTSQTDDQEYMLTISRVKCE